MLVVSRLNLIEINERNRLHLRGRGELHQGENLVDENFRDAPVTITVKEIDELVERSEFF